jgi:hypothetical protein
LLLVLPPFERDFAPLAERERALLEAEVLLRVPDRPRLAGDLVGFLAIGNLPPRPAILLDR